MTTRNHAWGGVHHETTREKFADAYVPNGQLFLVKYPKIRERLVTLKTIVAVGRYGGRSGEKNLPLLSATLVMERGANEQEGHAP